MNSLQIKYFLGAVESGSFSQAAEAFFISQPALSKHIRNLEQDLGVILFHRSSDGVALTDAGHLIYQYFSKMERELSAVLAEAQQISNQDGVSLRIGVPEDWDPSHFISVIRDEFAQQNPSVTLSAASKGNLMSLISRLRDGFFDLLYLPFVPSHHLNGISMHHLTDVPMSLIVSADHPLCKKETLSADDFRDELFLVAGHDGVDIARQALLKYLSPYRLLPKVETRENMSSVLLGVLGGEGVTLRNSWSMVIGNPALKCIPLSAGMSIYLAYRSDDHRPALRSYLKITTDYFSNIE